MDSGELFDAFQSDVTDTNGTRFWSTSEVYRYMNDAYRMFVRLIGGIPDFTSTATEVPIVLGEPVGVLDPVILKITKAQRLSDSKEITIINYTDLARLSTSPNDYGRIQPLVLDLEQGPVSYGIIGMQRNTIRWVKVPAVDDTANLLIYRLPFQRITGADQEFEDVDEDHHIAFLDWMKYRAYGKQDADSFDARKSEEYKQSFEKYCAFAKAENERYKTKVRSVSYGGI